MTKIRRALGTNPHTDQPRLVYDRRTQHYHLSAEVGSDWGRAEQLLNLADTATTAAGEIACLQAALNLIESRPGDDAISPTYNWLRDDYDTYSRIETALIDAASRLGELALAVGDTVLARWAANQGLTVVPAHEALYRLLMRAAHQAGDRHGIESAYDNAVRAAETYDPLEEIQDETAHLYHQLTDRRRRHR
jgi:DNA-binding SARP family transcriptional activator